MTAQQIREMLGLMTATLAAIRRIEELLDGVIKPRFEEVKPECPNPSNSP